MRRRTYRCRAYCCRFFEAKRIGTNNNRHFAFSSFCLVQCWNIFLNAKKYLLLYFIVDSGPNKRQIMSSLKINTHSNVDQPQNLPERRQKTPSIKTNNNNIVLTLSVSADVSGSPATAADEDEDEWWWCRPRPPLSVAQPSCTLVCGRLCKKDFVSAFKAWEHRVQQQHQ